MREIKFRAWSKLGSRFWYFDYTQGFNAENNDCFTHPMQYTGLKDKNGVEIYEGDIICQYKGKDHQQITAVYWSDNHCGFYISQNLDLSFYREGLEVIGNIHQDKELLNN